MTRSTSFHHQPSGHIVISNNDVEIFSVNTGGRVRWFWRQCSPGRVPTSKAHGDSQPQRKPSATP